jgi:hypothetical protein
LVRPPWLFEVELGFEGLVDGFDDLAERAEEPLVWSWFLGAQGGSDQGDATDSATPLARGEAPPMWGVLVEETRPAVDFKGQAGDLDLGQERLDVGA